MTRCAKPVDVRYTRLIDPPLAHMARRGPMSRDLYIGIFEWSIMLIRILA